jgi:hypothetical protein
VHIGQFRYLGKEKRATLSRDCRGVAGARDSTAWPPHGPSLPSLSLIHLAAVRLLHIWLWQPTPSDSAHHPLTARGRGGAPTASPPRRQTTVAPEHLLISLTPPHPSTQNPNPRRRRPH